MTDVLGAWTSALDELEASLADVAARLDASPVSVPAAVWQPPELAGPCPPELAARMADLAERCALISARVEDRRASLVRELATTRSVRAAPSDAPAPVAFDRRA